MNSSGLHLAVSNINFLTMSLFSFFSSLLEICSFEVVTLEMSNLNLYLQIDPYSLPQLQACWHARFSFHCFPELQVLALSPTFPDILRSNVPGRTLHFQTHSFRRILRYIQTQDRNFVSFYAFAHHKIEPSSFLIFRGLSGWPQGTSCLVSSNMVPVFHLHYQVLALFEYFLVLACRLRKKAL